MARSSNRPAPPGAAASVIGLPTTSMLVERFAVDKHLRRLCGWEHPGQVPSESTFSRAFAEFATCDLTSRVQYALPAVQVNNLYDLMYSAYDAANITLN